MKAENQLKREPLLSYEKEIFMYFKTFMWKFWKHFLYNAIKISPCSVGEQRFCEYTEVMVVDIETLFDHRLSARERMVDSPSCFLSCQNERLQANLGHKVV